MWHLRRIFLVAQYLFIQRATTTLTTDATMNNSPHKRRPGDETTNWKASDDFMLDEENLHDQLPSVEEIRMSAASTTTRKHTGGGFGGVAIIALVAVCILALIIGLAAGLSGNKNSSASIAPVVNDNNLVMTSSPTFSPTMLNRMDDTIQFLRQITDADVSNSATPQGQAARWIALEDFMQLQIPTTTADNDDNYDFFVERWVAAVIYFQMNGANWDLQFGWLGDTSVCDWQKSYPTADGGASRSAGIGCHNGRISDMHLRK
jgi:hypothetical protein